MPLEERDEALASVAPLLDDACAGRGRLLLVEGPPGIGKTRLLGAITERARATGMRTLRAQAGEFEQDFPYGIVRQLFEASIAGPSRDELLNGAADLARPLFELAEGAVVASLRAAAGEAMAQGAPDAVQRLHRPRGPHARARDLDRDREQHRPERGAPADQPRDLRADHPVPDARSCVDVLAPRWSAERSASPTIATSSGKSRAGPLALGGSEQRRPRYVLAMYQLVLQFQVASTAGYDVVVALEELTITRRFGPKGSPA